MAFTPPQPQFAVLAQGTADSLGDLRRALDARGIRSELIAPPGGCSPGGT